MLVFLLALFFFRYGIAQKLADVYPFIEYNVKIIAVVFRPKQFYVVFIIITICKDSLKLL